MKKKSKTTTKGKLIGKTAAITGSSKGIGEAIKLILLKEGCVVIDLSRTSGFDLTDWDNLIQAHNIVKDVDILINNVGGGGTWTDNDAIMVKNYGIMSTLISGFLQKKRKWGRVITISSIYGKEKGPNPGFVAAKSAQIGFMKSLAGRLKGTTFNTICPGHIDVGKKFPYKPKKIGQPEDVAEIVLFLCTKANHINGATITCDGGESHSF